MAEPTTLDPDRALADAVLTPEGRADPYPYYAVVREHAPAFRTRVRRLVAKAFTPGRSSACGPASCGSPTRNSTVSTAWST